jgi:hypothetical protein
MTGLDPGETVNCRIAAVNCPLGHHVWLCLARVHADTICNALHDGTTRETGFPARWLPGQGAGNQRHVQVGLMPAALRRPRSWVARSWVARSWVARSGEARSGEERLWHAS